jgi:hypothetical protein
MILFRPEHVDLILKGQKTQTRRLGKKRWNVGSVHLAKTKMLSKEHFVKLKVLDVYQEVLGDISDEDSIAEGYPNWQEYLKEFRVINKIKNDDEWEQILRQIVWVVEFKAIE